MTGIAEMFAALDGSSRYEMQLELELWCMAKLAKQRECSGDWQRLASSRAASAKRSRDWRAANAESVRAYDAQRVRTPRPAKTNGTCRQCARLAVAGKKSCAEHLAKARARAAQSGKKAA